MSIWEMQQCIDGYVKANSSEEANVAAPSEAEHLAMVAKYGGD